MKTFFLPALDTRSFGAAFDTGLCLARTGASGGHLMAHHAMEPLWTVPRRYAAVADDDLFAEARAFEERLSRDLHGAWDEACVAEAVEQVDADEAHDGGKITSSWVLTAGNRDVLGLAARQADLIVMANSGLGHWQVDGEMREDLILRSGRPALFVPAGGWTALPQAAAVAWDGSREAARALTAALPLLCKMSRVTIITVGEVPKGTPHADAMAAYLDRHGVSAVVREVENPHKDVEDHLREEADDCGAAFLIMGAYARPRWREIAFGGVTRAMLFEPELAVFMSA